MFLGPFHILALVYNVFSLSDSLSLPFMTNASKSPILHVPIYMLHVLSGKRGRQALQYTNSYRLDTLSHSHASVRGSLPSAPTAVLLSLSIAGIVRGAVLGTTPMLLPRPIKSKSLWLGPGIF